MDHPFLEGRFVRPEGGLLALGSVAAPSRGAVGSPVTDCRPAALRRPVTVAGPRRIRTGLPSTTGRYVAGQHTPGPTGDWRYSRRLSATVTPASRSTAEVAT